MSQRCQSCLLPLRDGATFCTGCGRNVGAWREVRGLFAIFAALLVLLGLHVGLQDEVPSLTFELWVNGAIAVLALLAVVRAHRVVLPMLRQHGLSKQTLLIVLGVALPMAVAVALFASAMNRYFGVEVAESPFGVRWEILLGVIAAPLTEEPLFRGAILGTMRKHLGARESLIISSVAFAICHFSIISLVTHVPMGLYFGWLSLRTRSLWPGILAHALHNALALLILPALSS